MLAARIICPGCKIVLTSAQAFVPGKLIDCPRCKLLFVVTANDVCNPLSRAEEIAAEREWGEADVPRPFPSRSPYTWRRRFRGLTAREIGVVFLACGIMAFLGGVFVTIYMLFISGAHRVPIQPAPAQPQVIAGDPAPARPVEIPEADDDRPPRKPAPALEDEPPGRTKPDPP